MGRACGELAGGQSEDPLGARVGGEDATVAVLHHHALAQRLDGRVIALLARLQRIFGATLRAEVAVDPDGACELVLLTPDRRNRQQHVEYGAVLGHPHRLDPFDGGTREDPIDQAPGLVRALARSEHRDRLAGRLPRQVAEQPLSTLAPAADQAGGRHADDSVAGGLEQRGELESTAELDRAIASMTLRGTRRDDACAMACRPVSYWLLLPRDRVRHTE